MLVHQKYFKCQMCIHFESYHVIIMLFYIKLILTTDLVDHICPYLKSTEKISYFDLSNPGLKRNWNNFSFETKYAAALDFWSLPSISHLKLCHQ